MAIAFDAFTGRGRTNVSHNSFTLSHTCSGTDRVLIVKVSSYRATNGGPEISGITYAGTPLTMISSVNMQANTPTSLWYLIAPSTGANNLVITYNVNFLFTWCSIASYTGVKQTGFPNALGTNYTSNGIGVTSQSNNVTPTVDDCWVVMGGYAEIGASAGAGTTLRGTGNTRSFICDNNTAITPATNTTLTINQTSSPAANIIIAMEPEPGGGGGSPTPLLSMMGDGS